MSSPLIQPDHYQFDSDASALLQTFTDLYDEAYGDNALTTRSKSLIAVAISTIIRCNGCAHGHLHKAISLGVSKEEIVAALQMAVLMGGGPSVHYARSVMEKYYELTAENEV